MSGELQGVDSGRGELSVVKQTTAGGPALVGVIGGSGAGLLFFQ